MHCSLEWFRYRRPLAKPLPTAHGWWRVREGILLRLTTAEGQQAWAEVSPLPESGSESLEQAEEALSACGDTWDTDRMSDPAYPALAAALAAARRRLKLGPNAPAAPAVSNTFLAPAQLEYLPAIRHAVDSGYYSFKLKLALGGDPSEERAAVALMADIIPVDAWLRLDANGAWSPEDLKAWTPFLRRLRRLEFVEQPMPPGIESDAARWSSLTGIQVALDESLIGSESFDRLSFDWPGLMVIKPAVLGDPTHWLPYLADKGDRLILSSSMETGIGLAALLELSGRLHCTRAIGAGTLGLFQDDWGGLPAAPILDPAALGPEEVAALWTRIRSASQLDS